jgi:hypothetical protein
MASFSNLFVDQGSDFSTNLIVEDSNRDPLDLTDLTLSGQIRRTHQSETAFDFILSKADATGGEILIELDDATTSNMKRGRYVYDIFASDSVSGNDFKIIEGLLEIVPRVTRTS